MRFLQQAPFRHSKLETVVKESPFSTARKVIFLEVCVKNSVHMGGEYLGRYPPDQVHPPWDQVHPPPGPGTPPRTRYTPQDQVHPQDQIHPSGTRYTPRTRYTPWDQVHLPQDQVHPPRPGTTTPQDQVQTPAQVPPHRDQDPRSSACWEIRATSGRYASYWNAFLFSLLFYFQFPYNVPLVLKMSRAIGFKRFR